MDKEDFYLRLERKIIIGMIQSDNFIHVAYPLIKSKNLLGGDESRLLVNWIYDYYGKRKAAPKERIQQIYEKQLSNNRIDAAVGDNIENILESLSNEAEELSEIELKDLENDLEDYANYSKSTLTIEEVEELLDAGEVNEARDILTNFKPIEITKVSAKPLLQTNEDLERVFKQAEKPLIYYPGNIGRLLNPHMYRQGFFIYLAQNKGGKSFILMDAGFRAAEQGKNVLIYQAGDMSEDQLAMRQAIYACGKSNKEEYCGPMYIPVPDCIKNLRDDCYESCRRNEDQEGPLSEKGNNWFEEDINFIRMKEAFDEYPNHEPCTECKRRGRYDKFKGSIWFEKKPSTNPLTMEAYKKLREKGLARGRFKSPFRAIDRMRIGTHSSESLTMGQIRSEVIQLTEEGWPPDIVIPDYMDLLAPDPDTLNMSPRDQENKKYQRGRRLSQDFNLLLLSASQSDADGFMKRFLDKRNFSEDRRKLDHITGMAGLNMSIEEKKLGLMRINEIVSRETDGTKIVNVLHRLQTGKPILGSF